EKTKPKTKAEGKAPFSFLQFVFIIALALDLSLIYVYVLDLFPGVEQNTVIPRLAQLLPIVGGTLLVSYLDQIRAWVLGLTAKTRRDLEIRSRHLPPLKERRRPSLAPRSTP